MMSAARAEALLSRSNVSGVTLRRILYRAPEPYKAQAWKLLSSREDADKLRGVLYSAPREYRLKAAELMIEAGCALDTVLNKGLLQSRKKVAGRLLEQGKISAEDLKRMILRAPEPYRSEAWRRFLEADLPYGKCSFLAANLFRFNRKFKEEAKKVLRDNGWPD